uniref:NACHT, LRR and PYD domains-containing protein 12-like n=1 Tax=Phascolarctos cinereus TaxID=38626 RepID=A0A6P5J2I8_PHACI|nr:NACHT, LRR and PYD domains-containing protein 12-like [Phascolarctos cinereus]
MVCEKRPTTLHSCRLLNCWLTSDFAGSLSCAFSMSWTLTRLDLSYNPLEDQGAALLFRVLEHPSCKLESLCRALSEEMPITEESCEGLGSVLGISQTLQWLDLSFNALGDHGMGLPCGGLRQANCQWKTLSLANCRLTPAGGPSISSVLSASSSIEFLFLSGNDLEDMGIQKLCQGLIHPNCKVQELKIQMCGLTWLGCEALASALRCCPSLRQLDLSDSSLGEEGSKWLCRGLRQPSCQLQRFRLFRFVLSEAAKAELAAVARVKPGLEISYNNNWTGFAELF